MFSRLYVRIYLAVLGSLLVFAVAVGLVWRNIGESNARAQHVELLLQVLQNALPPAATDSSNQRDDWEQAIAGLSKELSLADSGANLLDGDPDNDTTQQVLEEVTRGQAVDLTLFGPDLQTLASVGEPLPPPMDQRSPGNGAGNAAFLHKLRAPALWTLHLPDGRWLVARPNGSHRPFFGGMAFAIALLLLLLIVGLVAHPIARRITRRLEQLQQGVDSLGRGELSARVAVHGHDEVAALATSFNQAAARIEALVASHRLLLANASHELRTPLTRIRLAIELQKTDTDPVRKAALEQDIEELDSLIEGILLASRLDAQTQSKAEDDIDLLALAAEECARYSRNDIDVSGEPVMLKGDINLLRRLIRNLVDNALRHGKPPVSVSVHQDKGRGLLRVADHGAGVPGDAIASMFEPFNHVRSAGTGGTGLGLSLVRKIARHHGGDVQVGVNTPNEFSIEVRI